MTGISGNRSMTLTWDARNRISQINSNTFNYDPAGYRIQKNAGGTNNNYYLEGENLEAVYDGNNVLTGQFFRGSVIDEIVNGYQQDGTGKLVNYTYHHDALESVLGQSGHDGSILATQSYSAFGGILSQTGSSNNAQKYTGREIDSETGFYYYRARYYDPIIGRFISEDPKGFGAGVNFYVYCLNNPVNCNDPSGLIGLSDYINAGIRVLNKGVDVHPVTGIPFNGGFADFSSIAIETVKVSNLTGNRSVDEALANAAAGISAKPAGYTWHHADDAETMMLVPTDIHNATAHTGGAAWLRAGGIAAGAAAAGDAAASDGIFGTGITWNDVGNGIKNVLSDPSTYYWPLSSGNVGAGSDIVPSNVGSSAANGGFVLYPNKSNTNQMRSVYKK
jgi:RHS repeat-associated protein